jgi:hypothetical protein
MAEEVPRTAHSVEAPVYAAVSLDLMLNLIGPGARLMKEELAHLDQN